MNVIWHIPAHWPVCPIRPCSRQRRAARGSQLSGQEFTVPGMFIANLFDQQQESMALAPMTPPPQGQQAPPAPEHNGKAYYFKISAQKDGVFTVTNTRNGFTKTYKPRLGSS